MTIQTEEDLVKLKRIGKIVANTIQIMGKSLEPGMTTQELDNIGRQYLASQEVILLLNTNIALLSPMVNPLY